MLDIGEDSNDEVIRCDSEDGSLPAYNSREQRSNSGNFQRRRRVGVQGKKAQGLVVRRE